MLDKNIFLGKVTALAELYNQKLSSGVIKIYYDTLKNMSNDEFLASVDNVMANWNYSYMPKPAHLLNSLKQKEEDVEVEAQKEWDKVIEAIETHGSYVSVKFENLITSTALNLLSNQNWYQIASKTYEELNWIKKDFIRLYKNLKSNPTNLKDNILLGYCDKQNNTCDLKAVKTIKSDLDTNTLLSYKKSIHEELDTKKHNVLDKLKIKKF